MCEIKIRNVKMGDEKILAYIQTESWKTAFREILTPQILSEYTHVPQVEAMYQRVIASNRAAGYILTVDEHPYCIAFWGKCADANHPDSAELICIHSLCDKGRQGLGSMMIRHIFSQARVAHYSEMVLWVFKENTRARKFYEKHGFQCTNDCKTTFGAPEVMYAKFL
jgi:ribosomal protein S18 acetylase RimI-like enzyme